MSYRRLFAVWASMLTMASAQTAPFTLTSPDVEPGASLRSEYVFNAFGCTGQNISPALAWRGAPSATKSFALIVHDPDAQTGVGGFTHWLLYNIPAATVRLDHGAGTVEGQRLPPGTVQPATSFGTSGWSGPCPPMGDKPHRYVFTLYALGTAKLELPTNTTQAYAGFVINSNSLAKTSFTALFGR